MASKVLRERTLLKLFSSEILKISHLKLKLQVKVIKLFQIYPSQGLLYKTASSSAGQKRICFRVKPSNLTFRLKKFIIITLKI